MQVYSAILVLSNLALKSPQCQGPIGSGSDLRSRRGRPVTQQATFRARPGQKTSHGRSASPSLIPSLQRPARKRAPFLVDGPIVSAAGYLSLSNYGSGLLLPAC
ncbi:hypothetical protein ROHU_007983 [Labeo rohita]|uniref:Uncharacterized protein n=1 Tax=Labeo rohita TaxID=84645 RepID=A0A498MA06_LABRO|nr:hypothetical protein ROHU_007983 [Labeo rohita]